MNDIDWLMMAIEAWKSILKYTIKYWQHYLANVRIGWNLSDEVCQEHMADWTTIAWYFIIIIIISHLTLNSKGTEVTPWHTSSSKLAGGITSLVPTRDGSISIGSWIVCHELWKMKRARDYSKWVGGRWGCHATIMGQCLIWMNTWSMYRKSPARARDLPKSCTSQLSWVWLSRKCVHIYYQTQNFICQHYHTLTVEMKRSWFLVWVFLHLFTPFLVRSWVHR